MSWLGKLFGGKKTTGSTGLGAGDASVDPTLGLAPGKTSSSLFSPEELAKWMKRLDDDADRSGSPVARMRAQAFRQRHRIR